MKMKELFDRGEFVVSAEVGPPKGIHVDELVEEAKTYLKDVHAVNVTDNQSSVMRLGSLAMCKVLKDAGMNPIFQLACRDRSRIALESELSDEKQIYISTGLGGKGEKLRFYVLMTSKGKKPFQEYQRQTIEREFAYYLPKTDCEIERLTIGEQYVELVFLLPVRTDIKATLDRVINECNQYGDFLSNVFTITNVKELTAEEVSEIINKNGDD